MKQALYRFAKASTMLVAIFLLNARVLHAQIIRTVAGRIFLGDYGLATNANLSYPRGVAIDQSGNIYIADQGNQRIRKVNSSGVISTIAGNGNSGFSGDGGLAISANLSDPSGVAVDASGNIYIADQANHRIRKVSSSGFISTVAGNGVQGFSGDGGVAISANLDSPNGISIDASGNIYIADQGNHRIRKVSSNGFISTVAGNGVQGFSGDGGLAISANLSYPSGVFVDASLNIYIADEINNCIRKVSSSGIISTVAGNGIQGFSGDGGVAISANLNNPDGIVIDASGNMYITDAGNQRIRKVSSNGIINTVGGNGVQGFSGDGAFATKANLYYPLGVALDSSGNIYIADNYNFRIRKVNTSGVINTVAGNGTKGFSGDGGPATNANLYKPDGAAVDASGNIYIADLANNRIRKVNRSGIISTIAGNGIQGFSGDGGVATSANLSLPKSVAVDTSGNIYIADANNNRIRKVTSSGIISTIAGSGTAGYSGDGGAAISANLHIPTGVALDDSGNIYIADLANQRIRKVNSSGVINTVAGNGAAGFSGDVGPATSANLNSPERVTVDASGNIYIADRNNHRIRKVTRSGIISTIAGNGTAGFSGDGAIATSANLNYPDGVAVDTSGNIYISDFANHRIRKVTRNGIISTVAGNGIQGFSGDGGEAAIANLNLPTGVNVDALGNIYIADASNNRIREVVSSVTISGNIKNPMGKFVNPSIPITVCLSGSDNLSIYPDSTGKYGFNVVKGNSYTLRPTKNNDKKKANGVTTIDISLIQSHVLGKNKLNSPYKLIAADANNDKKITSIDITYIKRLILGLDTTFTGNRLWAFIDSTYKFPDTTNPFPYKDSISFTNLTTNQTNQSFIGVKLGDVNYDWNPAILGQQATTNQPLELYNDTVYTNNTNEIKLHLKANHFKDLIGMQFGLAFNKDQFDFAGIENNTLNIDYGTTHTKEGQLTFLWNDPKNEAKTVADGSELFTIVLHKKGNSITSSDLALNGDITGVEAYDKDLQFHNILKGSGVILEKANPISLIEKETVTVTPNPSNGKITLTIQSKSEKSVQLNLVDINGKKVMSKAITIAKGKNSVPVLLNVSDGNYFLTVEGLSEKGTTQIVILK